MRVLPTRRDIPATAAGPTDDLSGETATEEIGSEAVPAAPESHDEHNDPLLDMSEPVPGATDVSDGDQRVRAIIDAHPDLLRALPIVAAGCGLRQGELFGLALEDLDFGEELVRVRRQIKKLGTQYVYALPKNDRERVVPLPDWVAEALRVHTQKYKALVCSLPWEQQNGRLRTHNLLFRWTDDQFIKARSYSETVWKPALVAAGVIPVPDKDPRSRRRFETTRKEGLHQLRHYYASIALVGGVSIKELAEYLGHADPGFTLRTYAHLMPGSHDRARRAVDHRLFRPRAVSDGTATEQGVGARRSPAGRNH
ncbi:site-specific integrase [Sphaerisporangium sp. NPDC004334]